MTTPTQETEVRTVALTDGRVVEFAGKRQLLKTSTIDSEGRVAVTLDFSNGETRQFVVPDSLRDKFIAHGAEQKLGDATAGLKSVDEMVSAVDSLIARLAGGEWNVRRESAGGFSGAGVVVKALAKVKGKSIAEVNAWVEATITEKGCTRQALYANLRQHPALKPVIAELEAEAAEKAGKAVDAIALLDDF